jgi:hypothetical protein
MPQPSHLPSMDYTIDIWRTELNLKFLVMQCSLPSSYFLSHWSNIQTPTVFLYYSERPCLPTDVTTGKIAALHIFTCTFLDRKRKDKRSELPLSSLI